MPRRTKLLTVTEAPLTADGQRQGLAHTERSAANLFRRLRAIAAEPLALPD